MKITRTHALMALGVLAGAFLHFRNLDGVVYLDPDEARSTSLLKSGPMLYLLGRPISLFFMWDQSALFYLAASLGFASIILFYGILRLMTTNRVALVSSFIYTLWPIRINFARTLYPSVFVEFFFLVSLLSILFGLKHKRPLYVALGGIMAGFEFFCHAYSYASIAGLLLMILLYTFFENNNDPCVRKSNLPLTFLCCAGLTGLGIGTSLYFIGDGYNFVVNLFQVGKYVMDWSRQDQMQITPGFFRMADPAFSPYLILGSLPFVILLVVKAFVRKNKTLLFLLAPFFGGSALFIVLGYLKLHVMFDRHFVWLSSVFALGIGSQVVSWMDHGGAVQKKVICILLALFTLVLMTRSYLITEETYKITEITSWLRSQDIKNSEVITHWWQINNSHHLKTKNVSSLIPGKFVPVDHPKPSELVMLENRLLSRRFQLDWRLIYVIYKSKGVRYLITSGLGVRTTFAGGNPARKNLGSSLRTV
jgi:hypothetical protein